MTDVRVGQVWADNDPRSRGRTIKVHAIEGTKAVCSVLTNDHEVQTYVDGRKARPAWARNAFQDQRGKIVRISLSRFKPTSSGYKLVQDVDVGE